ITAPETAVSTVQKHASPEPKPVVHTPGRALQSPATTLPQSSPFPLPTVYGVYAVSGGHLHELEALAGRVLDQRVFMSTPIRTVSRTVLPDGQIVFVVYRRDVASSAPERVTVRVIAKIMRAMTFNTAGGGGGGGGEGVLGVRNAACERARGACGEKTAAWV